MIPGRLCALVLAVAVLCMPAAKGEGEQLRIIAVVDESPITMIDLGARLCVTLIAARLEDTPEARLRMGPLLLGKMIEEQIRLQAAARRGITISEDAIDERLSELADGMDDQHLVQLLAERGISVETLRHMIRAELAPAISDGDRARAFIDVRSPIDFANVGACAPLP